MSETASARRSSADVSAAITVPDRRVAARLEPIAPDSQAAEAARIRESLLRRSLFVADVYAIVASLFLVIVILGDDHLRPAAFLGVPVFAVLAKAFGLYDRDDLLMRPSTLDEVPQLWQLATLMTLVAKLSEQTTFDGRVGDAQLLAFWVCLTVMLALGRLAARQIITRIVSAERCLVIGDADVLERLREKLTHDTAVDFAGSLPFEHVVNDLRAVRTAIVDHGAQRVVIAPPAVGSHDDAVILIRAVKSLGVRVSVYPGVLEVIGSAVEFDHLPGMTLLGVKRFGLTRSSKFLKRCMDVFGACVALVIFGLPMLVMAALIKRDSAGPVFFRQTRVGRDGGEFEIVKFRTMVDGADSMREALAAQNLAEGVFKIPDDPRITRVGSFLRRTSLDELPQLFNVLRGEMSLVGPRPLVVYEDERVTGIDRRRLELTPGMTGPWQVAGSARMSLAEMVKIDYLYVADWSLWNDTKIIVRTARYVVSRNGQ